MHVPDGMLSPRFYLPAWGAAGLAWAWTLRAGGRRFDLDRLPRLASLSALAFLLMSLPLPLPGGTSAHASGIGILAVSVGPGLCFLAVSLVLLLQALVFGMGGITTLPLNALAMGLAGGSAAWAIWRALRRLNEPAALFCAGWLATALPALLTGIALGLQPRLGRAADGSPLYFPFGLGVAVPALLVPHLLLGVAEGLLTLAVCRGLARWAPPDAGA
ncbi:cobalamin biosynthesis protein CbiM [bacterium]|nr:cobalamin biosynthesis protein CbiM [bacterium]